MPETPPSHPGNVENRRRASKFEELLLQEIESMKSASLSRARQFDQNVQNTNRVVTTMKALTSEYQEYENELNMKREAIAARVQNMTSLLKFYSSSVRTERGDGKN